ncbi:hypothetical protein DFJ73DRAFT_781081 [Zopfochytrium polystomum]|nr:hypothetical protein DFJ73DRAFT_781081 [Zopfochytrium polystomum]
MRDHVHRPSPPHQQPTVLNETDQRAFRSSDSTISTSDSNSIPTSPEEKAFLNEYSQRHAAHVHTLATAALTTLSLPSHAVILALLFVKRFLALQELPQALSTPTKVFLAGLLLADAHLCDSTVSMKTWAVITGARGGGSQVTAIKTAALNALQFDVAVGAEFYSRWLLSVKTFFKEDVGRLGQFE